MIASAVEKLNLIPQPHPYPYNLVWLERGTHVTVNRRVYLNFSIGDKYVDDIWCDVVPIDACHLLLGRPWQFDRDVAHNGLRNTYSFLFADVKFVLLPSIPTTHMLSSGPTVTLLSRAASYQEFEHEPDLFLLIGHEVSTTLPTLPKP